MEQVVIPVLLGLLVEAVVHYVEVLIVQRNLDWRLVSALVISIVFAVAFEIDIFSEAGFLSTVPYVGSIFTGIVFSRVANIVNDGIDRLRGEASDQEGSE